MASNHTTNPEGTFPYDSDDGNDENLEKLVLESMVSPYSIAYLRAHINTVVEIIKCGITEDGYDGQDTDGKDTKFSHQIICFLCTSPQIAKIVGHFGLYLKHLNIVGELDLRSARIRFPLKFESCDFSDGIVLKDAKTRTLEFDKGKCRYFVAPRIQVDGKLRLRQVTIHEGIELQGAKTSGHLDLAGSGISPIKGRKSRYCGKALVLNHASIGGSLLLARKNTSLAHNAVDHSGFLHAKITGEVSILGATIDGDLDCREAKFTAVAENPGGKPDEACVLSNPEEVCALRASLAEIKGYVYLSEGFVAEGLMLMKCMNIHGDLYFSHGEFYCSSDDNEKNTQSNKKPNNVKYYAISLDRSIIHGAVFMDKGFTVKGQVRLIGTTIMKDLDCSGGKFLRSKWSYGNDDIYGDNVRTIVIPRGDIHGDVNFKGIKKQANERPEDDKNDGAFKTDGIICLTHTKIGSDLVFSDGIAFEQCAPKCAPTGNYDHGIRVNHCEIRGEIICWLRQKDEMPRKANFNKYNELGANSNIIVDFSDSQAGGIDHGWNLLISPEAPQDANNSEKDVTRLKELNLERFAYSRYEEGFDTRIDGQPCNPMPWIRYVQGLPSPVDGHNVTSVFQHLRMAHLKNGRRAKVIDSSANKPKATATRQHFGMVLLKKGERAIAEKILMQVEKDKFFLLAESAGKEGGRVRRWVLKLLSWIGDNVLGYGYRPIYAIGWISSFIALGILVFQFTYLADGFCPIKLDAFNAKQLTCEQAQELIYVYRNYYVDFNPITFSIDNLFSLGNFSKISDYWGIKYLELDPGKDWWPWLGLGFARGYLWFHRAIGWLLIPLAIAGITTAIYRNKNL